MTLAVDFGYWRCSDRDGRRGLLWWDADSGDLIYNLPGGNEEVIAAGLSEANLQDRLLGWQHLAGGLTVDWVRARFLPWQCPSCYGRRYVSFNLVAGVPVPVPCWCEEAPSWL